MKNLQTRSSLKSITYRQMKCHNTLKRLIQNLYLIISFVVIPVKSHQAIQQLPLTIHFTFGGVSILPHDDRTIPYY